MAHQIGRSIVHRASSLKAVAIAIAHVALLMSTGCVSGSGAAAHDVDAQQRIHGMLEALPMPPDPASPSPYAVRATLKQSFLDVLTGTWVVTGQLDAKPMTLDLTAGPTVGGGGRLKLHMVSRQRDPQGRPVYEAAGDLTPLGAGTSYSGVWIETFDGTRRLRTGIAEAEELRDQLTFAPTNERGEGLSILLALDAAGDTWDLVIDDKRAGWTERFATMVMRRAGER